MSRALFTPDRVDRVEWLDCPTGPPDPDLVKGKVSGANQTPLAKTLQTEHEFCPDDNAQRKAFAGYRAELALAGGHALHELADGTFLVTWRGLSRSLADLDAVAAFARQVGAKP